MAYTVNLTNGNVLVNIEDGTLDNTTQLLLPGRNRSGYGEILNENLVRLMEHFANNLEPRGSLEGQIWYDTTDQAIKVKRNGSFRKISITTESFVEPDASDLGDLWFDQDNDQLKIYNGADWVTVGPDFSKKQGYSGAKTLVINDTIANLHTCVGLYANGHLYAIISEDSTFTPNPSIVGFATVKPGYNITLSQVGYHKYYGTASNADNLDGLAPATYLRTDKDNTISANLTAGTDGNLTLDGGIYQGGVFAIESSTYNTIITNTDRSGNVIFYGNIGDTVMGVPITSPIMTIRNDIAEVAVRANPTTHLGVVTKQYADSATANLFTALSANVTTINANVGLNINSMVANVTAANIEIGRLRANITASNAAIVTANTAVVNYVNTLNSAMIANVTAANAAIVTANTALKNYLDDRDSTLTSAINLRANIASPALTGTPTAPTASAGTNSTQIATTGFVRTEIQGTNTFWQGSRKYVSTVDPDSGTGSDGDFWFKYQ
jgi:hypothetical protein